MKDLREQIEKLKEYIAAGEATIEKAEKYDKQFENLRVVGECMACGFECETLPETSDCKVCHGTGKISRELTDEERIFLVMQIVSEIEAGRIVYLPNNARVEVKK